MKVNTDSLILGSWVEPMLAARALDIGTGSGLLALMLAQKLDHDCEIDGIEIDPQAAGQAKENMQASPWGRRLRVISGAVQEYHPSVPYNLIISNPPYFAMPNGSTQAYQQQTIERKTARQATGLSAIELFSWVSNHLSQDGFFYCLYPYGRVEEVVQVAQSNGLNVKRVLHIHSQPEKEPHVSALQFGFGNYQVAMENLFIHSQSTTYSENFRRLCASYYLNF
ncbi:methyltransferase domain-containing protein [Alteromonas aestuariivivens]|uniref:Methyltransferase domain-containing protein n=1 Tax=Alteromonas aestuariivivens TaxID=1938339 RepID=A0A3D8M3A3_9ALTE|nr:methyltransferase [Alteromonas aestuariivivens]RDV24035.1 methyltransferase domain-containing protein [Alteromonas aestuariivivens]